MPTAVKGVAADGRVSLTWAAPASNGGAAISDYVVQFSSSAGATWTTFADGTSTATSATVTGLRNGTSYVFRVAAVNAAGPGAPSVASAALTPVAPLPPSTPFGVAVTSSTDSSVTLSWSDGSGETDYRIERSGNYAAWTEVGRRPADATTFTDTIVDELTGYRYRVIAVNTAGASAPSDIVAAEFGLRAPDRLVATVVHGGRIDLKWVDRSMCETGYVAEQFDDSTNAWVSVGDAAADSRGMSVTGSFAPNNTYQFRVRGVIAWSDYTQAISNDVTVGVATPDYPTAPEGLAATAFVDSVRLSWDPRTAVSVVVERGIEGGDWTTVTELASPASSFEDESLEESTGYVYRIAFRNAHGTSGFSDSVSAATAEGPSVAAAYRSTSDAFVRWTSPLVGVTGITIERSTVGSEAWTAVGRLAGSETGYADSNVVLGTSYRYRITFERGAKRPFLTASSETGSEPMDSDGDQLVDGEELAIGTNPRAFSTDGDLLGDGFERSNGLNPLAGDEDGNGVSDQYDDFDADGLATWQEVVFNTSTSRADANADGRPDGADSDGDGVFDGAEVSQGSDPASSLDGGEPPTADARIKLRVSVGDPSESHSEQWGLRVGPITHVSPTHGKVGSGNYYFDVGKSYPITLQHQGSLGIPDYDWYANILPIDQWEFFVADDNTPLWLIGPYQGDWMSNGGANYASLEAQLHIPRLDVDVDSRNDGGFAIPDDSPAEDRLENDATTGKLVFATTGDVDQDGIVDSSDFEGIAGGRFVPMVVRLSSNLAEAHPTAISLSFDHDPNVFRLWKPGRDAGTARTSSDVIPSGVWTDADSLGLEPGQSIVVYVEALSGATAGPVPITTTVRVEAARWNGTLQDTVHLLPVEVDLDVDSNNDGWIDPDNAATGSDDPIEDRLSGRIVFVNSDDDDSNGVADVFDVGRIAGENDLAEVVLAVSSSIGSRGGSLVVTYDETVIRLYTRADRSGGIVSGSLIEADKPLYAEGRTAGTSLVTVTLTINAVHVTDTVKLTVLPYPGAVDVDVDSDNNDAFGPPGRTEWEETLEDHPYGIGKLIMLDNPSRIVTPIVLEIAAGLPEDSPVVGMRIDWNNVGVAGSVRLWNRAVIDNFRDPAAVDQGGNQLFPGKVYKLSDLTYDAECGRIVIYAEGITENETLKTLAGVEASPKVDERIRGTLIVNGDDSAFDEVKYIVANEDSFYYHLQTRQEVRNALASWGVYKFKDMPQFGLQPKSQKHIGLGQSDTTALRPDVPGLKAMVYQDYITGKDQYVLAFGGTDDNIWVLEFNDWRNNIRQGLGWSAPQYTAAMQIGDAVGRAVGQTRLIVTGHSLGGGLASAAALVAGVRADTFNGAGLHEYTLYLRDQNDEPLKNLAGGYIDLYSGSIARYQNSGTFITNHYVDHEILTFVQGFIGRTAIGGQREMDGPKDLQLASSVTAFSASVAARISWSAAAAGLYALGSMVEMHSFPSIFYGLLVTEGSLGGIRIDMLGYNEYF